MKVSKITAWEGTIMRVNRRRWTVLAIAMWVLALGLATVFTPVQAEAKFEKMGWMVYSPNHPNGCSPLPYDCYVVWVYPD
jgi:heme/copper-type cytochrome/quinol oxidase subunit 1